jgi:hypothetical protein
MLAGQVAPLAFGAAAPRAAAPSAPRPTAEAEAVAPVSAARPAPAPLPFFAAGVTATKVDSYPDPNADGKADPGEVITYTVTINNAGPDPATGVVFNDVGDPNTSLVPGSVKTQPVTAADTYAASGNIPIALAAPGVLSNDVDPDTGNATGLTVTKVQGNAANVGVFADTTAAGRNAVKGSVKLNSDGSFDYEPPPGFEGADAFTYEVSDGTLTDFNTVTINISGMVWFVQNGVSSLNRGTFTNPFTSIGSFNAANTGTAPNAEAGDFISLRTGTGTYNEVDGFNLLNQQKLIGNAVQFSTVFTAAANSSSLYTTFASGTNTAPTITTTSGDGIDLALDNTVRGLNVGATTGFFKIDGAAVGSPVINGVNLTGGGGALRVSTSGAFGTNVTFGTLESSSSPTANLELVNVTGTLAFTSAGTGFTGSAAAAPAINVNGGGVNFTYTGNVTKATTGALLSVAGGHNGTLTFNTGTLSATSGTGLQFSDADGAYNFSGTTTLGGGDAGVDILNNSGGTFNFNASTTITNPTGTAFNVGSTPGSPNVTYSGTITQNTAAQRAVNIDGTTGGAIAIATVTAGSVAGGVTATGININNANGSVTFTTLNLGTSGTRMTAQPITITGGSGAKALGTFSIFTGGGAAALAATDSVGEVSNTTGAIDTAGGAGARAVSIDGPAGRTPINLTLTTVTTAGATNSINLVEVSGTKFQVTGTTQINTRTGTGILVNSATTPTIQFATVNVPNTGNAGGHGIRVESSSSAVTIATATISDANTTSTQAADSDTDFLPQTDGDGDAIFLKSNTGSFTLNGGTLSNCGNDCIDARNIQNFVISGVTVNNPGIDSNGANAATEGGHGIALNNVTGTNTITNSTVTNWETAARDGLRWQNNTGTGTLTIHGSTFSNSETGSNAILYEATGSSTVMTLNVGGAAGGQPNTFSQIFGNAITHNAGGTVANSTPRADLNVIGNTFSGTPNGGQNSVSSRNGASGRAITVISNNTFDGVGKTLADTSGVIDLGADATDANAVANGNFIHFTVTNNIIRNIGTNTACLSPASPLDCHGKRGIDVFLDDNSIIGNDTNPALDADDAIVISGNVITNMQRSGIIFDVGQVFNGSNMAAKVTNNRVGIDASNVVSRVGQGDALAAAGEWSMLVENRNQNAKDLNILISNNLFYNGNGGAGSALNNSGMLFRSQRTATLTGTVTNNTFNVNTSSTSFGVNVGTVNTGTPFVCFDATGNTISAPGGGFALTEAVGDLNVEQASAAALSAANGGATVTVLTGAPDFGVACAAPPAGSLSGGGSDAFFGAAMAGAPITTTAGDAKSKSAFGGGVTDRPFIGLPRTAAPKQAAAATTVAPNSAAATATVAPKTGNVRKATSKATAGALSGTADATTKAEKSAPVTAREGFDKRAKRALVQSDTPGAPNGTGVGISNLNIGTLAANDSVTITFQVTVDNPYSGGANVSNQGTVSGSNFSNVLTDDPAVGGASDPTLTPINANKITINNAKVAEPTSPNTVDMTFTVSLEQPAAGPITVNFATANGTATAGTCGDPGADYVSTSGQVGFATGQQVQTINVPVCSDSDSEGDETFVVNLTGPVGATLNNAQGTGTITVNTPGTFLISELRTTGPAGATDEFVEFYNNTDSPLTVAASDASAGYGIFKMGADCTASPVLIGTIPNGTVIPARGHYLAVGAAYSLANYGGTGAAAGNLTLTSDIEADRNVAVFSTANIGAISTVNRLDAVGFGANNTGTCNLLREPGNLAPVGAAPTAEGSYFRKECDFVGGSGCAAGGNPKDSNDNSADFMFADTQGTFISGVDQHLGAPGPESLTSPIRRDTSGVFATLLDSTKPSSAEPNRHREFTAPGFTNFGTLSIRRRVTNTTGAPVTRLRFRIVEMTTFPNSAGQADLRAITSTSTSVGPINDAGTCGSPGAVPCTLTVQGTTLETPPAQPNGGGYNSTLSAGTITLATPLNNNSAINLQFVLGISQPGTFRFYIIVEALP